VDLVGEAVVKVVVHLSGQLIIGEVGKDDFVFVAHGISLRKRRVSMVMRDR